jgi:hypothetical protein
MTRRSSGLGQPFSLANQPHLFVLVISACDLPHHDRDGLLLSIKPSPFVVRTRPPRLIGARMPRQGKSDASRLAKLTGSFSGAMRTGLVSKLDHIGLTF